MGTNRDKKGATDRRDFLKLASLGTVMTGATIVAGGSAQASEVEAPTGSGYRETEHVKAYYGFSKVLIVATARQTQARAY